MQAANAPFLLVGRRGRASDVAAMPSLDVSRIASTAAASGALAVASTVQYCGAYSSNTPHTSVELC
jgi:hypothetical protein